MVYRIAGGIFILLLALGMIGFDPVSENIIGTVGIVAGIALLAGF